MTVNGWRNIRLVFKFGLLVSLPLTGYLWALTGASHLSLAMSAVCVVMAIGAETLASATEGQLSHLRSLEDAEEKNFQNEASTRDEKIRQMDRIVETLSNQNHDLRGKLVSIHGEVHRVEEETAQLGLNQPAEPPELVVDNAAEEAPEADVEEPGDVTDISSLRRR
jgi:hypothetical protein